MMQVNAFGKLPVAVQTVLGLALVGYGVSSITLASAWSEGNIVTFTMAISIGVLYLVNGIPPMLEGFMTMVYKK